MRVSEKFSWEGRTIVWGRTGSGPAVVLCHGTPFSSVVWSKYADALSDKFTVYLWDMPGYGVSSKDASHTVNFHVWAKAFVALLQHWKLERPHVIAHDFGACTTLRATLFEGAEYASLMLVDAVAIPPVGSPFFRFVQKNPTTLNELPQYVHEAIVRAYIRNGSHRGLSETELTELVAPWVTEDGHPAFYRQIEHYDEECLGENERHLSELKMPVHVVWGKDDIWIPMAIGQKLASLIPGAKFTEVDEAGHLIQYDAPVALSNVIRGWVTDQVNNGA